VANDLDDGAADRTSGDGVQERDGIACTTDPMAPAARKKPLKLSQIELVFSSQTDRQPCRTITLIPHVPSTCRSSGRAQAGINWLKN